MKKNIYKTLTFLFFFFVFFSFVTPAMATNPTVCTKDADCPSYDWKCKITPPMVEGVCVASWSLNTNTGNNSNSTRVCSWKLHSAYLTEQCKGSQVGDAAECEGRSPMAGVGSYYICCCKETTEVSSLTKTPDLNPLGNLQVKIPGLEELAQKHPAKCGTDSNEKTNCTIPWIAVYIKALYNYLLYVGGILAVIALMVGGVLWLVSAGNASRISEAKSWISGSIIGIVILLLSYTLLYQINPELTRLRALNLKNIDSIEGDSDTPSQNSSAGMPFSSSASSEHLTAIGIQCPQGGGSAKISEISKSFAGKVVYRFGSKNGQGSEQKEDKAQETYGLLCPNNDPWREKVVCYDCSGFARQVLWCAGFSKDPGMGTSIMFNPASAEKIESCGSNTINNKELIAGDLIGWHGHVIMYIGEGKIAEVFANRGYSPAKAYKESAFSCDTISAYQKKYGTLYIKRISDYQN